YLNIIEDWVSHLYSIKILNYKNNGSVLLPVTLIPRLFLPTRQTKILYFRLTFLSFMVIMILEGIMNIF
ncbi:MAG: hypothetical protein ACP5IB_05690, partial [Thermoplasmata archaeon]